ncbi:MAG: hypothetical protein HF982_13040 [Desulfobacteraceae bacterium]|nr:hypothetical protein [Desulfobacteraceae bacterium]MBC2720484.1 hypothetical protein [Desulfobacteraceae bacterium]
MEVTTPATIIPGFPYEGALYWFFSERSMSSYQGSHSYYMSLYGPEHDKLVPRATALAALFERMILAPADAGLPDYRTYHHGKTYNHPELRITMSWEHNEWDDENIGIAKELLKSVEMNQLLSLIPLLASDEFIREHFLCRTLLQMRLADFTASVLIGDSFFHTVCESIVRRVGDTVSASSVPGHAPWVLEPRTLDLVGLTFPANSIDSFSSIRQSRQVSEYAAEFRVAATSAMAQADVTNSLLAAMKKAMDQEEIREHASGAFQAVGSGANVGGLIPFVGTIASGIGIGSDVASRALKQASARKQWYLLGPKMHEIALKSMLSQSNK